MSHPLALCPVNLTNSLAWPVNDSFVGLGPARLDGPECTSTSGFDSSSSSRKMRASRAARVAAVGQSALAQKIGGGKGEAVGVARGRTPWYQSADEVAKTRLRKQEVSRENRAEHHVAGSGVLVRDYLLVGEVA